MADEKKVPDQPEHTPKSAITLRAIKIPLKELLNPAEGDDGFGHRFRDKYSEASLGDVIASLKLDVGFECVFDQKRKVASIKLRVDGLNDSVERLARAAGQLSQVARHIAALAQTRHAVESLEGPQAALRQDESLLDQDLLKQFGLEDMSVQFEQELRGDEPSWLPIGMTDVGPANVDAASASEDPKK